MEERREVAPTHRLYELLSLAALALLASLFIRGNIEFLTLLGTSLFLLSLISAMYARLFSYPPAQSIVKQINIPSAAIENELLCITIEVENKSGIHIPSIEIRIPIPPELKVVKGSTTNRFPLAKGTCYKVELCVEGRLGSHGIGPLEVVYRDPLALFISISKVFDVKYVKIHPRPMPPAMLREVVIARLGGLTKTRRKGFGTEFFGIREYFPGDEYRHIEWKAYARTSKLYVKLFEHEASVYIIFLLDARTPMFVGPVGRTPFELSSRTILSVAMHSAKRGDNLMLIYLSDEIHGGTPFVRGDYAVTAFSNTLASIEWPSPKLIEIGRYISPRSLGWLLRYILPQRMPREKTMVFLFTSLFDEDEAEEVAFTLRRFIESGHEVHLVAPLVELFEIRELSRVNDMLYLLRSKDLIKTRLRSLNLLKAVGIPTIVVHPKNLVYEIVKHIELARLRM
ncbi:MAG: hypothetical protein DRO12_01395 [Thermoprotei archaeon]|nr:MAG: hypothetical protein DRO12_01395 [Thermoprotei archaeon]